MDEKCNKVSNGCCINSRSRPQAERQDKFGSLCSTCCRWCNYSKIRHTLRQGLTFTELQYVGPPLPRRQARKRHPGGDEDPYGRRGRTGPSVFRADAQQRRGRGTTKARTTPPAETPMPLKGGDVCLHPARQEIARPRDKISENQFWGNTDHAQKIACVDAVLGCSP